MSTRNIQANPSAALPSAANRSEELWTEELPFELPVPRRALPLTAEQLELEWKRERAEQQWEEMEMDLKMERDVELDFPGHDPWMGRSVRPSRERERNGNAHRYEGMFSAAPAALPRLPYEVLREEVIRSGDDIGWLSRGEVKDSLQDALMWEPSIMDCLPELEEHIFRDYGVHDLNDLSVQVVQREIFNSHRGVLMYTLARRVMSDETSGRDADRYERGIWTFGVDEADAREEATQYLTDLWTDEEH